MKKLFFLALVLPSLSFAFDTSVKGFIALDAFNYKKIEGKESGVGVGIGVLDLKIFAEQDNMTAALKLDLDGKLSEDNGLFEEAYASYRGIRDFRFSLGKGVVKYQNLHWGAVQNTYYDGGSVLGSENSFRKLSRKAFASVSYGHRTKGFLNTFWFWGDSQDFLYNSVNGDIDVSYNSDRKTASYKSTQSVSFDTSKQTGFANKIEIYSFDNWTLSNGLAYYKKKVAHTPTYAFDLGANYETSDLEIWIDILYGHTHKLMFESYSTYSNDEYFIQTGFEKNINESWSWVNNGEILYTKNQQWTLPSSITLYSSDGTASTKSLDLTNSGAIYKTLSYKLETAAKYKLSKTAFTTIGVLYETKNVDREGGTSTKIVNVNNPNKHAYQFLTSVSFWY